MRSIPGNIGSIHTDEWKQASYYGRLNLLQGIENHIAQRDGRSTREVEPIQMESDREHGYYDSRTPDYIYINRNFLIRDDCNYSAVDTVLHEGRHAYQDDVIKGIVAHDESERALWEKNFKPGVYNDPESGPYYEYRYQPIEVDANDFASKEIKDIHSFIGEDKAYDEYLDNRDRNDKFAEYEAILDYGEDYKEELKKEVEKKHNLYYGEGFKDEKEEKTEDYSSERDKGESYDNYIGLGM